MLALLLSAALGQTGPASVTIPRLSQPERNAATVGQADSSSRDGNTTRYRSDLATAPAQVGDQQRTAASAPALSTTGQSRAVRTEAVGGHDRCDPALASSASVACRNALETRAGEYTAPSAAPVSAEARLLLLTDPQPGQNSVDAATRRLGGSLGVDALAGSAANDLAGAINGARGATPPSTVTPAAGSTTALPAGVPTTVVLGPR